MAKLSSTHIYRDLYVDGTINGKLSGNASTATTLQTARTINGTSFNGSSNITTANWGTARTITIGNTGKSVNGSGNVSWTLAEIGAAASSHNHGLLHDNHTVEMANTTTDSGWSMINSSYNGYMLKSIRTNASAPNWICNNYSAGVAFGGSDTKGVLSCAYNAPSIKIAGGNGTKPVWWVGLTGTTGTTYDLNRINTAYNHSQAKHAPTNAQKNSDITKAEIEAKLTGAITSHTHAYAASSHNHTNVNKTMITTPIYNASSGILVDFNTNEKSGIMAIIKIYGNSYSSNPPIEAIYQFYDYADGSLMQQTGSAISGPAITLKVYRVGGKLKAWFKQPNEYCTFKLEVAYGNNSSTPNVTLSNAAEPTGATQTVTITPNRVYSAAYKPTPADIGAAVSSHGTHLTIGTGAGNAAAGNHTHSYLPLGGGTMTGKITTPNNAQGITIGDDVTLCDRNIADHLVLEGSTAANGGITFGSGKDTNIYRGGANLLKTDDTMNAVGGFQWNGQSLDNRYAAKSHGTHLTIGTGSGNAAAGNHTHNQINSRGTVTCESGVAGRPAVSGLSMSEVYSNGYPTPYGNVISLRGMGDGQILVGWSGTDGAHAPVYVRSKRDNTNTANWSGWAQVYTTANKPSPADIGALPLSGGTMTGSIKVGGLTHSWVDAAKNSNAVISSTASAGTFHPVYTFKTNNGSIVLAGYQGGLQCSYLPKAKVDAGDNTVTAHCQIFTENGGAIYQNVVEANQHIGRDKVVAKSSSGGIFTFGGAIGLASTDGSVFQACFRNGSSRAICDIGTSGLKGRLYIRSGEGPAGSGVSLENRVSNGTNYVQWLSPEAGTIALTSHISDRTKKDNIVYVGSKDSEFTNKDFYDFIKKDLGLATYTIKEEYATTDTHTKLNFIAQDILYDYDNDCINKVGNLIVQTEDAMEQQGTLKFDPDTFTSVIAGALKESINKIEELEDKNKKLEERLAMLEEKFSALENK